MCLDKPKLLIKEDDSVFTIAMLNIMFICTVVISGALDREKENTPGGIFDTVAFIQLWLMIGHYWLKWF